MNLTLAGLILTAVIALVGWIYALIMGSRASSEKSRANDYINLAQTVTQERVERIAGERLLSAIMDDIPKRLLTQEQRLARTDANVDILIESYKKNMSSK